MVRLLVTTLLIAGLLLQGVARADMGDAQGFIAAHCGASYVTQYARLRAALISDFQHVRRDKIVTDAHDLNQIDARCWSTLTACGPESIPCNYTAQYAVRNRYLDVDLLFLDFAIKTHDPQSQNVANVISESEFICAQYWVTDPQERTGHDSEGDATLSSGLRIVRDENRTNGHELRGDVALYPDVWNACASGVGVAAIL